LVLQRRANKTTASADGSQTSVPDLEEEAPGEERVESVAEVDEPEWQGFLGYIEFWAQWESRGFFLSGAEDD
jgi:hypothetical protein